LKITMLGRGKIPGNRDQAAGRNQADRSQNNRVANMAGIELELPEIVDAEDCFIRGMSFSSGAGVAVDLVQAHMWFNIAAMRGHIDGAPMRKEIAAQMADSEIGMAQRAARDWLKAHPQAPIPVVMPEIRIAA
jgi:hypothetical protein